MTKAREDQVSVCKYRGSYYFNLLILTYTRRVRNYTKFMKEYICLNRAPTAYTYETMNEQGMFIFSKYALSYCNLKEEVITLIVTVYVFCKTISHV